MFVSRLYKNGKMCYIFYPKFKRKQFSNINKCIFLLLKGNKFFRKCLFIIFFLFIVIFTYKGLRQNLKFLKTKIPGI